MKPYSILLICWFAHVNCASINSSVNVIHPEDGTSELIEPLPLPRQPKPGQANATVLVSNIFHKLNGQPNSCFRFSMANLLDHGTLKITPALVSYPGSGNSWMRMMIPPLTGMLTGSYCEKVYPGKCIPFTVTLLRQTRQRRKKPHRCWLYCNISTSSVTCNVTKNLLSLILLEWVGLLSHREWFDWLRGHRNLRLYFADEDARYNRWGSSMGRNGRQKRSDDGRHQRVPGEWHPVDSQSLQSHHIVP